MLKRVDRKKITIEYLTTQTVEPTLTEFCRLTRTYEVKVAEQWSMHLSQAKLLTKAASHVPEIARSDIAIVEVQTS